VVRTLNTTQAYNNLELVIKEYGHRVQSLAFVYLKNRQDAEDIAQDVFLTYYRKAPVFHASQQERAWIMTVTANKCKSLLRAKYRQELPLPEDLSYLPPDEWSVMEAVLKLEEKHRLPIHLHYYEGYSIEDIAKILKVRPGTVGSWLSRGRTALKQILKEDYFYE
jgi:RNA polymerase sigma-70 factor (ECF subfamily)